MYAKVITSFEGVIQALSVKERPRAERSKQKSFLLYANRTVIYYSKFTCIRQAAMLQMLACLCNRPNTLKYRGGRVLVYVARQPVLDG